MFWWFQMTVSANSDYPSEEMAKRIRTKIWDDLRTYYKLQNLDNYAIRMGELMTLYTTILVCLFSFKKNKYLVCNSSDERECCFIRTIRHLWGWVYYLFLLQELLTCWINDVYRFMYRFYWPNLLWPKNISIFFINHLKAICSPVKRSKS